jgi:peptidoglycan hydrolase FlgJ
MDLIADVIMQADAAKLKAATRSLEKLSRVRINSTTEATFQLANGAPKSNVSALKSAAMFGKDQSRVSGFGGEDSRPTAKSRDASRKEAMRDLETVLATKMVEGMMPKDQSRLYGEGTAGEIWRGLHIDAMGKALASQGLFSTSKNGTELVEEAKSPAKKVKLIVPFAG